MPLCYNRFANCYELSVILRIFWVYFCVVLCGVVKGALFYDGRDLEPPERKKHKIALRERPVLRKIFDILEGYADNPQGCPRLVLNTLFFKKGEMIVLENVMDLAFRNKLIITYDKVKQVYHYTRGVRVCAQENKNVEFLIAEALMKKGLSEPPCAIVAYDLYVDGYDFPSFYYYKITHEAVRMTCAFYKMNDGENDIKAFLLFLDTAGCKNVDELSMMANSFNLLRSKKIPPLSVEIARYIFDMEDQTKRKLEHMGATFLQENTGGAQGTVSVQEGTFVGNQGRSDKGEGSAEEVYVPQPTSLVNDLEEKWLMVDEHMDTMTFKNAIKAFFWRELYGHYQKKEGCPRALLEEKSGRFSVFEVVLEVACEHDYSVHYDEVNLLFWLKEQGDFLPKVSPPLEHVIAEYICNTKVRYTRGDVLWEVYQMGYRFKRKYDFRVTYDAVRLLLNIGLTRRFKDLRRCSIAMRDKGIPVSDLNEKKCASVFKQFFLGSVGFLELRTIEKVVLMRENVYSDLIKKSVEFSAVIGARTMGDPYNKISVVKLVQGCLNEEKECTYPMIQAILPQSQNSTFMAGKCVLNHVFKNNIGVVYNGWSFIFCERFVPVKPMIPPEVVLAYHCCEGMPLVKDRVWWGYRLYWAGYDFCDYRDFEEMLNAVCVVFCCNVRTSCNIERARNFLKWLKAQPDSGMDLRRAFERYNDKKSSVKREDFLLIKKAQELALSKVFNDFPKNATCEEMILLTLKYCAKYGASIRMLSLYTLKAQEVPRSALAIIMNIVFKNNLHIKYDKTFQTVTLLDEPREPKKKLKPLWGPILHMMQKQPLDTVGEHAYAAYEAGYDLTSIEFVEALFSLMKVQSNRIFVDKTQVSFCRKFLKIYGQKLSQSDADFFKILNQCSHGGFEIKNLAKIFLRDAHKWHQKGVLSLQDLMEMVDHFSTQAYTCDALEAVDKEGECGGDSMLALPQYAGCEERPVPTRDGYGRMDGADKCDFASQSQPSVGEVPLIPSEVFAEKFAPADPFSELCGVPMVQDGRPFDSSELDEMEEFVHYLEHDACV